MLISILLQSYPAYRYCKIKNSLTNRFNYLTINRCNFTLAKDLADKISVVKIYF